MSLPIFVVDAFTSHAFAGNPAAVVVGPEDWTWDDEWMQQVAAEMRHSETAYVRPRADGAYDLRWFTPTVEVSLCGHATLASMHVLATTAGVQRATFATRSGPLGAAGNADGTVTIDFPVTQPEPTAARPDLAAALGTEPVEYFATDRGWLLCVLRDAAAVRALAPDFDALRRCVDGVYVTARSDDPAYDVVSRCFGPGVGIDEDPVTGSMHSMLSAYWCPRLGTDEFRAYQASGRGGAMTVRRAGDRALLTGRCVTVLGGDLLA